MSVDEEEEEIMALDAVAGVESGGEKGNGGGE